MTKLLYLDCPTGISGDMCLGALVHAGVPLEYLIEKLSLLGIAEEYRLWSELVQRQGQQATKVHVDLHAEQQAHTTFAHPANFAAAAHPPHSGHHHAPGQNHPAHHPPHDSDHPHPHPHSPEQGHAPVGSAPPEPHHTHYHAHSTRHLPEIEQLIVQAGLPPRAEAWSLAVFRQLAAAEAAVHGIPPEQVHFHEVGATDAIVDIVGTCLGLDWLDVDRLHCSPLPTGGGTVWAAHGRLPVPTPAVLKLWEMRQVPIYSNGIDRELVTPTGAAIVTALAAEFGAPPPMVLQRVGLGAGGRDLPIPNILRLWVGEQPATSHRQTAQSIPTAAAHSDQTAGTPAENRGIREEHALSAAPGSSHPLTRGQEMVTVLETQIDDLNPQAIGYVYDRLFAVGALDVFTQAIGMKKSRPGILLTVICAPEHQSACESVLFQETTTLGIRQSHQQRTKLDREFHSVETCYGQVQIKVARDPQTQQVMNVQPEYEDCAQLARQHHRPWREIHQLALQQWQQVSEPAIAWQNS